MSDRYDLMAKLPALYGSPPFAELQRVLGEGLRAAGEDVSFTLDQLWPQTASGWGLALWESAYGIPTELSKDLSFRRSRLISKLRGQGVPTRALIESVAASFVNGEVSISEDAAAHAFTVTFVSVFGIPPNLDDLTAAINEVKPAHLTFGYVYRYRTNGELAAYTHEQLSAYTHDTIRGGDMP